MNNIARLVFAILGILGLILLIGNSAAYVFQAFQKFPQADDYRLTLIHIKPWFEGTWSFDMLWGDVHPNPLHGIVLILSSTLESMRFDSLPFIVLLAICCKWLGYSIAFSMAAKLDFRDSLIAAFGVGLVIFSFNATVQYQWNSVGIAQIYHAIGALYLVTLVRFITRNDVPSAIVLFLVALIFQIIARQYAVPWMVATVLVFILSTLLSFKQNKALCLKLCFIVVAVIVLEKLFHHFIDLELIYGVRGNLFTSIVENWGNRPFELFKHLLVSITSSAINTHYLSQSGFSEQHVLVICIFYNLLFLVAIAICIANITKPAFQLALVMMIFMVFTIFGSVVYRSSLSTQWLHGYVPRYVSFRDVGAVGVLLTFVCLGLQHQGKHAAKITACLLVAGHCYVNILFARYSWSYLPFLVKYQNNVVSELVFVGEQIEKTPSSDPKVIQDLYLQKYDKPINLRLEGDALNVIAFWKYNKLSVFSRLQSE